MPDMLTLEQFTRMREYWNFSFIHLHLEWENLTKVPEEIKNEAKRFVNDYTSSEEKRFANYMQGKRPGLFFHSAQNGTGKTSVIHQIAKDLVVANKGIRKMLYMTGLEVFKELKKTFNSEGGLNESELLDQMMLCDVFFLDDLDKIGKLSEYEKKRFTLILDKRYTEIRPIVITGNKSIQQMRDDGQLEQHIYSRLSEMCNEMELRAHEDFRLRHLTIVPKKEVRKYLEK